MDRHYHGTRQTSHYGDGVEQEMPDFDYFGAHHHNNPQSIQPYTTHTSFGELQAKHIISNGVLTVDSGLSLHTADRTSTSNVDYPQSRHTHHQRNHSNSTQSSHSSSYRSSGSSFSQWQPRFSAASTNSTWSQFSGFSEEQHITQTECAPDAPSAVISPGPPPPSFAAFGGSTVEPPAKRTTTAPRQQVAPKKEPFQTCVSRKKRSRSSQQLSRYWCTSCEEGFKEKYDWKRHEETYQERTEMFACELCNNVYFLDKDFVHHHQKSHRCRVCAEKQHVELARKPRLARSGWGCGFCSHFSNNWAERCNHISKHFEKEEKTMEDWHHSQVIFSLLQRPEILRHWCRLLEVKQRTGTPFRWRRHDTGRVEGFPESNVGPQLQDLLEYYNPGSESPATIVQIAFDKGLKERALPNLPVPEENLQPITHPPPQRVYSQPNQHAFDQNEEIGEVSSWPFLGTIPEDPFPATDVCTLDYDALSAAFSSSNGFSSFQH